MPSMKTEKKSNQTYAEIKKRLREPIPESMLSQKPASRNPNDKKITYVNVTDVKDLLDERIGGDYWDATFVAHIVAGERYICWVKIRIHAQDGIFDQDGVGDENVVVKGFGSVATNAYAQAFRRAAEGHGLARELWRGELSEEQWSDLHEADNEESTKAQIGELIQHTQRLGREEANVAKYFTNSRVELFGEMTKGEATHALKEMRKIKTPAKT